MSQSSRDHLKIEKVEGVTIVTFIDTRNLTDENIQEVGDQLYSLVEDEGHTELLLNFVNVRFLSSVALGKLLNLKKKVGVVKGKLRLCCLQPDLLEVFKLSRLDRVFDIDDDDPPGALVKQ